MPDGAKGKLILDISTQIADIPGNLLSLGFPNINTGIEAIKFLSVITNKAIMLLAMLISGEQDLVIIDG